MTWPVKNRDYFDTENVGINSQGELVFHDTIPLEDEELKHARERASTQKDIVLSIFRDNALINFTPPEVLKILEESGYKMLITSVRRSITDLTKEGRLRKCDYSERREGAYKTTNRTWKYNREYIAPLNPK